MQTTVVTLMAGCGSVIPSELRHVAKLTDSFPGDRAGYPDTSTSYYEVKMERLEISIRPQYYYEDGPGDPREMVFFRLPGGERWYTDEPGHGMTPVEVDDGLSLTSPDVVLFYSHGAYSGTGSTRVCRAQDAPQGNPKVKQFRLRQLQRLAQ